MSHVINPKHIAAACHTASNKDVRYYLVGVFVDGRVIVSTDGGCLSAYRGEECESYLPPFIVPLEAAKMIGKLKQGRADVTALPDGRVDIGGIAFKPVDGIFPDYRRVISKVTSVPHAMQVSPDIVAKFAKVAKSLGAKGWPEYFPADGLGGVFRVAIGGKENEFIGVAMPFSVKVRPVCGDWL